MRLEGRFPDHCSFGDLGADDTRPRVRAAIPRFICPDPLIGWRGSRELFLIPLGGIS